MSNARSLHCGIFLLVAAATLSLAPLTSAVEIDGAKLDDVVKVGDQNLKLNGAGIRHKMFFKVYAAGLYLQDKRNNLADIDALPGAKRITLVMLRDIETETFGRAFTEGINNNTDAAERAKIVNQMAVFSQMFAATPVVKRGDALTLDWIPGAGTLCMLNGKKLADIIPDVAFYHAMIKIWLGQHPADADLKAAMLGDKP